MDEYNVSNYDIFDDAINTTTNYKNELDSVMDVLNESKMILSSQDVFMGPAQESCMEAFAQIASSFTMISDNFSTMSGYLSKTKDSYQSGDSSASNLILSTDNSGKVFEATASSLNGNSNSEMIWNYLIEKGFSPAGAAGIMGNLERESGFISGNVQNGMGYSDEAYVNGIKSGAISRDQFIHDSRGFGIAQWTYYSRKAALYDALGPQNIDNLSMQLDFMLNEMSPDLKSSMMNATSPAAAAQTFHRVYERSADRSTRNRENSATNIYNQYV